MARDGSGDTETGMNFADVSPFVSTGLRDLRELEYLRIRYFIPLISHLSPSKVTFTVF